MSLSKKEIRKRRREDLNEIPDKSTATKANIDDKIENELAGLDERSKRIIKVRYLMNQRDTARAASDFSKSDSLREKLIAIGVEVKDQKNGPSGWKFIDGSSTKLDQNIKVPEFATRKKMKVLYPSNKNSDPVSKEQSRNKAALEIVTGNSSSSRNFQGISIEDLEVGTGTIAENGKKVKVFYVGKLKSSGKVFDSSTSKPFTFKLGRSEVIRGWDIGVLGMAVGGRRRLVIPPEKAYGKSGAPPAIPGNATLIFDIQLLEVK